MPDSELLTKTIEALPVPTLQRPSFRLFKLTIPFYRLQFREDFLDAIKDLLAVSSHYHADGKIKSAV
ncbi:hypothetical protein CF68_22550 [Cupriavidus sp. SK-4]|nr:hypothetical protein CF68_22550 [Cupriavidus sp. SK-4]